MFYIHNMQLITVVAPVTIVRLKFSMQFLSMQTSELFINFRDGEDFFQLLGIIYPKLVVHHCQSKHLQAWKNMAGQVGSGYLDPTRPDPPGSGPDPTRRFCQYSESDPTRPDPRVDPTRDQLCTQDPECGGRGGQSCSRVGSTRGSGRVGSGPEFWQEQRVG